MVVRLGPKVSFRQRFGYPSREAHRYSRPPASTIQTLRGQFAHVLASEAVQSPIRLSSRIQTRFLWLGDIVEKTVKVRRLLRGTTESRVICQTRQHRCHPPIWSLSSHARFPKANWPVSPISLGPAPLGLYVSATEPCSLIDLVPSSNLRNASTALP